MPREVDITNSLLFRRFLEVRRYIFIIFILCATISINAQIKVESKLDSTNVLIGAQVKYHVNVVAPLNSHITFPTNETMNAMSSAIEVLDMDDDTVAIGNGLNMYTRTYNLTAWENGKYNIPSLKLKINGRDYMTNKIPFEVKTVEVDTTNMEDIRPAEDVQDNPFSWSDWYLPVLLSILAVILCTFIYYLFIRLSSGKSVISKIIFVKKQSPYQKAMNMIEQIKQEHLAHSDDQKVYYTRLTDALRDYLEDRFGINAKEMTSNDIISRLHKEELSDINELKEVFETADLVKFAKYSVQANINDMNLANVAKFIVATKQDNAPIMEKVEEESSKKERREARSRRIIKSLIFVLIVISIAIFAYVGWIVYELLG